MSKLFNQIPDVMDRFDFEQVQKVMKFLDWKWAGREVTIDNLRSVALQCLHTAIIEYENMSNKDVGFDVATGGFIARVETFSRGAPRISLTFYVDHRSGM